MLKQYLVSFTTIMTIGKQYQVFHSEDPWKDFNKNLRKDVMNDVKIYLMKEIKA